MTGKATVYGIDGSIAYTGPAVGYGQDVTGLQITDEASVDEFMSGDNELLGLNVRNKRRRLTVTFYPKASTVDLAKSSILLPPIPAKVTLSGFPDTATPSLGINGDWVYSGGASLAFSEGQAQMTLPLVQYLTSPLTATQLTTAAS